MTDYEGYDPATEILIKWDGEYWYATSNQVNTCIIAHGSTPEEALDQFLDLYRWDKEEK